MVDMSKVAGLQDVLRQQKGLQSITNRINAATGIQPMVVELRPLLIDLFRGEAAHVYVREKNRKDVYTFMVPTGQAGDVKTVLGPQTLPGYIANEGKMIHISISINLTKSRPTRIFPSAEAGTAVSASLCGRFWPCRFFTAAKRSAPLRFSRSEERRVESVR